MVARLLWCVSGRSLGVSERAKGAHGRRRHVRHSIWHRLFGTGPLKGDNELRGFAVVSDLERKSVDAIGWLLLVILAAAPLFFGGHAPIAWGINAGLIGLAVAGFAAVHIVTGRDFPVPIAWLASAFVALAVVVLWIYLQSVSWTPNFMHHGAWESMGQALDQDYHGAVSLNPGETRMGLLRLVTAGAAFWLALQLGRQAKWAFRVLYTIAVSAAAYALYGVFVEAYGWNSVLWRAKQSVGEGVVTATFVGPNAFAMYAVLGLLATLGLLVRDLSAARHNAKGLSGSRATAAGIYHNARVLLIYAALAAPLVIAIVMSGSRAGLLFMIAFAGTMPFLGRARRRRATNVGTLTRRQALVLAMSLGLGLSAAVVLYSGVVVSSLQKLVAGELAQGQLFSERRSAWWISIRAMMDAPLTGFGYGAFVDTFAAYRDGSMSIYGRWMKAHNGYIEAIVGLGIPMALLLFYAIAVPVYRVFVGALTRRREQIIPLVAAAASVAVGMHQLIDFSVYMQGVTLVFAAILGIGTAQSWSSTKIPVVARPEH